MPILLPCQNDAVAVRCVSVRFEHKVDGASVDNLGGFCEMTIGNRRPEKPIRLPLAKGFFKEIIVICCDKAARSQ